MTIRKEAELVTEAVEKVKRGWSSQPRIVGIEFEIGEDHTGDPSVDVLVLLAEETRDEDWTSKNLNPITDLLRQEIRDRDIDRIVYVRFLRPSERNQTGLAEDA